MNGSSTLQELREKVAAKKSLEVKLNELEKQRITYEKEELSLRIAFRKEQEDVEKLEGRSLANYFFQVIGKLDEKLDQERQEAYAAKVKLDSAQAQLSAILNDIDTLRKQLLEIQIAQDQYNYALQETRLLMKNSDSAAAKRIIETEEKITALEFQKKEIQEAVSVGKSALSTAKQILSELESADGWNTWDMFGGGGAITHLAKHAHLDDAQDLVYKLQRQLGSFKTELADIQITADVQVNLDGFLRFADYFFDGLFADWAVGDKISQSIDSVNSTKRQISNMLDHLKDMELSVAGKIEEKKAQLETLIVQAESFQ